MKRFFSYLLAISLLILSHGAVAYYALRYAHDVGYQAGAEAIIDSLYQTCLQHGVLFTTPFGNYRCTYGTDS